MMGKILKLRFYLLYVKINNRPDDNNIHFFNVKPIIKQVNSDLD